MKGVKGFVKGNQIGYVHGGYRSKELRSLYMAYQNMISRYDFVPHFGWEDFPDFLQWSLANGYVKGETNFCRLDEKDIHCPENSIWKPKGRNLTCRCCEKCSKIYWIPRSEYASCPVCGDANFTLLTRSYAKNPWGVHKAVAKKERGKDAKKEIKKTPARRSMREEKKKRVGPSAAEKTGVEKARLLRKREREERKLARKKEQEQARLTKKQKRAEFLQQKKEKAKLKYYRNYLVKVLERRIQDSVYHHKIKELTQKTLEEKEKEKQRESNEWNRRIAKQKEEYGGLDPIVYGDDTEYKADFLRGF